MNLNPYAREFQPSVPITARPVRASASGEPWQPLKSNNSLNHPNVGPGQLCFDLPDSHWDGTNAEEARQQGPQDPAARLPSADDSTTDDLDEASVLEAYAALQAKPSLKVRVAAARDDGQPGDSQQQQQQERCSPPGTPPQLGRGLAVGSGPVDSPLFRTAAAQRAFGACSGTCTPEAEESSECLAHQKQGEDSPQGPGSPPAPAGEGGLQGGHPSPSPDKVGPDSFELMCVVGQGAFGKVFQVRMKSTGKVYAMKIMRKERILEKDHSEYIKSERNVLTAVFHPYIVTLRYSFQTATKLYLVLDFINGGHLFFQLYRAGIFDERLARLYAAELVLAISHLHSLNTIHRDLKPENVLLDSEGHIRVTDFGLAKGNMDAEGRTNSFIGTMEYMAPEIISGQGHGKAVDWWSMGILLYEMLVGMPPFKAKGRQQLQKQILTAKLKMPPYLSSEAQAILKALLTRDPVKRLGHGPKGSANVKAHAFFRAINWELLMQRRVASPFKPTCRSEECVDNFDRVWTDQAPEDSPCSSPTRLPSNLESAFEGFSYVAPSLLANMAAPSMLPQATEAG